MSRKLIVILGGIGMIITWSFYPVGAQVATVTRTWTAVGNDSLSNGPVALYQLKWSETVIPGDKPGRDAWWAAANNVSGMPTPLNPGLTMSVTVSKSGGLWEGGHTYFWMIKSADAAGNVSEFSNGLADHIVLLDIIRPAPVKDLR